MHGDDTHGRHRQRRFESGLAQRSSACVGPACVGGTNIVAAEIGAAEIGAAEICAAQGEIEQASAKGRSGGHDNSATAALARGRPVKHHLPIVAAVWGGRWYFPRRMS